MCTIASRKEILGAGLKLRGCSGKRVSEGVTPFRAFHSNPSLGANKHPKIRGMGGSEGCECLIQVALRMNIWDPPSSGKESGALIWFGSLSQFIQME